MAVAALCLFLHLLLCSLIPYGGILAPVFEEFKDSINHQVLARTQIHVAFLIMAYNLVSHNFVTLGHAI